MPGIDFRRRRDEITMEEVLDLSGFACLHRRQDQWYRKPSSIFDSAESEDLVGSGVMASTQAVGTTLWPGRS